MLLDVRKLSVDVEIRKKFYPALVDLNFSISQGDVLGLVGESGSGKSITALAILGLLDKNFHIKTGEILFQGQDLLKLRPRERRMMLGNELAIIFQDPMNMLNPLLTIYEQMAEMITIHNKNVSRSEIRARVVEALIDVEISYPEENMYKYPHEFSGGQRQRILIAMAILNKPKLLIADESTTALDIIVQNKILKILKNLCEKHNTTLIIISHDLGLIEYMSNKIIILYAGKILEIGRTEDIADRPRHPYTIALNKSLPENNKKGEPIFTIRGRVPTIREKKENCPFYPRCSLKKDRCLTERIEPVEFEEEHLSYCLESR